MKESNKKILFVATQFPPSDSIGTQRIVKFIKYLKLKGWEIHVLTLDEKYYRNSNNSYQFYLPDDIHVYRKKKMDIFGVWDTLKKFFNGTNQRQQVKKANRDSNGAPQQTKSDSENESIVHELKELFSNLLQYPDQENGFFFNAFFTAFRIISQHKIPFVFVSSPPHSPVIPITLLRKIVNFFYIVDFRDPWARSQWQQKKKHLYEKIENRLDLFFERLTLETADVAIFNTDKLKNEFAAYYDKTSIPQKFHFISNGFDPDLRSEVSEDKSSGMKSKNRTVILHTGTLYKKRNPQIIFEALMKFRESSPGKAETIHIMFVGTLTDELQFLKQFIKDNCLNDQVEFLAKLSYAQIVEEMKKADWLLLLQPGTTFQIPAKFYDYLLVGKPIWGVLEENSVGETAIKKLNIGHVSHCQSAESIVDFFKMITNGKPVSFIPDESELEKYSLPLLVDQFEKIILNHPHT